MYIVDCVWEYFVLVGSEARGQRRDIRLALAVATVSEVECPSDIHALKPLSGNVRKTSTHKALHTNYPRPGVAKSTAYRFAARLP